MTRIFLVTFLLIQFAFNSVAQRIDDIFKPDTKVTWLGLDFTGARFIGDRERLGSDADVRHLIESWNELMIIERDKFDIALSIDKPAVKESLDVTKSNNASLDLSRIFSNDQTDFSRLRPVHIEAIVSDYDFKGNKGIGLMFNVESFSKPDKQASAWVTFVNMETKTVYFTERLTADPGGGGLRNYWGNAIYDMMKQMRKSEFEMWRKKYYRRF